MTRKASFTVCGLTAVIVHSGPCGIDMCTIILPFLGNQQLVKVLIYIFISDSLSVVYTCAYLFFQPMQYRHIMGCGRHLVKSLCANAGVGCMQKPSMQLIYTFTLHGATFSTGAAATKSERSSKRISRALYCSDLEHQILIRRCNPAVFKLFRTNKQQTQEEESQTPFKMPFKFSCKLRKLRLKLQTDC